MNDLENKFNQLDNNSKKAINAYRSGREFKITAEMAYNFKNILTNGHSTLVSSIVNASLSCELFLKSIIMIKKNNEIKIHELADLYKEIKSADIDRKLVGYNIEDELNKINDSFIKWRYCYESNSLCIHISFLFDFCKALEEESRKIILDEFNIDMNNFFHKN